MKERVFIDTAGWLALINPRDQLHAQAVEVYRNLGAAYRITTDGVLTETCNALSAVALRRLATAFMERVQEAQRIGILQVVHVSEALFARGWKLFRERPDKEWSLTDCISFVVMQSRRCRRAFTSDSHFAQAGFERLIVP